MIEFVLLATLVSPQQQPTTYTPPRVIYTPPPVQQNGTTAPQPTFTPPPIKPIAPVTPPVNGGRWSDKMWERYKNQGAK